MLDKIFHLKENGSDVKTEFLAGFTTYIAMAYIIIVNPAILAESGMDHSAAFTATILAAVIGTLIMAIYANVPYAQAPGMGLNVLFSYTICIGLGFTWQETLAMVFICGIINIVFTVTRLRKILLESIPLFLQQAIGAGIGIFIAYLGIKNANFIVFAVGLVDNGIAPANSVTPIISNFNNASVILALIGLAITALLVAKKIQGGILFGIILTTLIGIPLGVTNMNSANSFNLSLAPSLFKLDFAGLFSVKAGIIVIIMTIFTLSISDIFDTIGTFIGTGQKSGIFKGGNDKKLQRALYADSVATSIGALLGTSNTTTYVESAAGIGVGGRTGLTSLFTSLFLLLSLFTAPVISAVPMAATAPALIIVGLMMIDSVVHIDWQDPVCSIPAFFTIIFMPFAFSITTGIQMGFIFYVFIKMIKGEFRDVHPILYVFVIIFIIDFIYKAVH
jgi:AGZA family xanthine/uracil permease-like MFS transporter